MGCGASKSVNVNDTNKDQVPSPIGKGRKIWRSLVRVAHDEDPLPDKKSPNSETARDSTVSNNDTPKPKPKPTTEKSQLDIFRQEGLVAHNKRRVMHGALPVELSDELNDIAQRWAEYLANNGKFEHSPKEKRNGAGENLAAHSNVISADDVVEMWYREIDDYDFSQPGFKPGTGHFTQVVWRDCTHVGMGMSTQKGQQGMYIYVANYKPHGNMMGDFEANVLPKH